ncbi:hypothetical protein CDO46_14200 [Pigmentiphaga sp. NML030171]|uniref:VOC family protein n=1 Tax=Pigmentiphaga daeguensis TaxID=414049 RepID=A0ABN1CKH3_9BURK|nr:VOC family protein [Pigmentiphaga sp. NML030171]OVZ62878.1 hypothetical protein CDO46_14200 [Pigmentiphaga sp. NML030171]
MRTGLEAAYIGLDSTAPADLGRYLTDVVGLMPGEPAADGAATWRVDGKAQRVWVREGARNDAACIAFEAVDAQVYDRVLGRLSAQGWRMRAGTADERAARRVRDLTVIQTPWDVPLELVTGLEEAATPFASPHFPEGFVTQGQGFGHFVFAVGDAGEYDAARRFAIDGLGLVLSDWLRLPMGEIEMHVSFFHCNPRHHSLAIAYLPRPEVPQRLHHINFEVAHVRSVGLAYDRALRAGTPLANTLGQHANDGMVSFYSLGPDGWRVEIGATGRTVGEDWNDVREYDRISDWGHLPPDALAQALAGPPSSSA